MLVRDLMDSNIVTLRRESLLPEIYAVMVQYRQSDFPVVDGEGRLVGMLYEESILRPLFEEFKRSGGNIPDYQEFQSLVDFKALSAIRADQIMVRDETGVAVDSDLVRAGAVMAARKVRHLTVLSQGRVVGMISDRRIFMELMRAAGAVIPLDGPPVPQTPQAAPPKPEKKLPGSAPPLAKIPEDERRRFSRRAVEMKIAYKLTDADGKASHAQGRLCFCLNLSPGGMMLLLGEALPLKQMIDVAFELPGAKAPIKRLARITRMERGNEPGMYHAGIMFLVLSLEETAAIRAYLESLNK